MNDDKTKKMRSWAREILEKVAGNPDYFDDGVVEAAEFILKETKHPIPEGSLLFREAKHESRGKVTVLSEKPAIDFEGSRSVYALQLNPEAETGTTCWWYNIEELDFYPDSKSNIKSRLDFHTLKTGTRIRILQDGGIVPATAYKVSIDRWEITGCTTSFTDQEMEDFDCEWEII